MPLHWVRGAVSVSIRRLVVSAGKLALGVFPEPVRHAVAVQWRWPTVASPGMTVVEMTTVTEAVTTPPHSRLQV